MVSRPSLLISPIYTMPLNHSDFGSQLKLSYIYSCKCAKLLYKSLSKPIVWEVV